MSRWRLLAGLGLLLAGGTGGWFAHARTLDARQAAWVDSVEVARRETAAALALAAAERQHAQEAKDRAVAAATAARAAEHEQQLGRARIVGLEHRLALAASAGDSIPVLLELVAAGQWLLEATEAKADHWQGAWGAQVRASAELRAANARLEATVVRQDSLLAVGVEVVGSSEGRLPLVGIPCPVIVGGYGIGLDGEHGLQITAGIPIRLP